MYHLRIRNNFAVFDSRKQEQLKVSWLFTDLEINQIKVLYKIYYINKQLCYLAGSKVKNRQGKPKLQIIISFTKPELAIDNYRQRWQIESAFRVLKTSGFNIEDTHLNDIDRINKLVAIVLIAFVWAYKVGIHVHLKQIGIKVSTGWLLTLRWSNRVVADNVLSLLILVIFPNQENRPKGYLVFGRAVQERSNIVWRFVASQPLT